MIQRVQTLYLLGGTLAILLMFFFPFAKVLAGNECAYLYLHSCSSGTSGATIIAEKYNPLLILLIGGLTSLGFFISIFLYKNRIRQMRFNAIVFVFNCVLIGLMFWAPDQLAKAVSGNAFYKEIGIIMPLVSLVLVVFANKAIKKDEMKVRAADRIR